MMFRKKKPPENGKEAVSQTEAGQVENRKIKEENIRLRRAVDELTVLNEIARAIAATGSFQQVIDQLVKHTLRSIHAEQVVISLVEKHSGADPVTVVRHCDSGDMPEFHLTQGLLGLMLVKKEPFLTNDPHREERLQGLSLPENLVTLLCVPLIVKGEIIGILAACNKKGNGGFQMEDQRLLAIIAGQSAQVLDNARLREEEALLAQMQRDIQLAREIQVGLLPHITPKVPGYDLATMSIPAQSVGGDYYDFIPLDECRMGLCLGDVSGKGIPASLLMANLQATMRGQAHVNPDAGNCLNWANQLLFRSTSLEKFATLFYGILDPCSHQLNYSNAGHERPLHWTTGGTGPQPAQLGTGGLMLGALPEFNFRQETISLAPGDLLVIYSDGVTDAVNELDEPFGDRELVRLLDGIRDRPAGEIVQAVADAVGNHAGKAAQLDDITLLVLRREVPAP